MRWNVKEPHCGNDRAELGSKESKRKDRGNPADASENQVGRLAHHDSKSDDRAETGTQLESAAAFGGRFPMYGTSHPPHILLAYILVFCISSQA